MKRYTTKDHVIAYDIAPALGAFQGNYDMDAIFAKAFTWQVTYDEQGNELTGTGGFEQCVSEGKFWVIVQECRIA